MSDVVDLRVPVLLPSANPAMARKHLPKWVSAGYRVVMLQDRVRFDVAGCEVVHEDHYHGYAWAVNKLYREVPGVSGAEVVVLIGDDMDPDPILSPGDLRRQFLERFPDTFGVMQPIGDDLSGVDRICGSPWIGRSFASRVNGGTGPLWSNYYHFFADEELHDVATLLGVLWKRRDVSHYHDHWSRNRERPPHLSEAQARWDSDKALHASRKAMGFPGHEPTWDAAPAKEGESFSEVARAFLADLAAHPDLSDWEARFRAAFNRRP